MISKICFPAVTATCHRNSSLPVGSFFSIISRHRSTIFASAWPTLSEKSTVTRKGNCRFS
ncbi:unnamed protein product, partial [Nesidiocoris tenuis]